eukprot:1786216-Lingulodinium_polyedra.AAC.1
MEPHELKASGWLDAFGVEVVPSPIVASCTAGPGRLIDFVVASSSMRYVLVIEQDLDADWKTH